MQGPSGLIVAYFDKTRNPEHPRTPQDNERMFIEMDVYGFLMIPYDSLFFSFLFIVWLCVAHCGSYDLNCNGSSMFLFLISSHCFSCLHVFVHDINPGDPQIQYTPRLFF